MLELGHYIHGCWAWLPGPTWTLRAIGADEHLQGPTLEHGYRRTGFTLKSHHSPKFLLCSLCSWFDGNGQQRTILTA